MTHSPHVAIVGAGVIGLTTACFLARRGACVTVIERDAIDDGASVGNAGQVALGHGPLPRPGLAVAALRWMLNGSSPLYIPPKLDRELMAWLWQFRRACGRRHHDRSMELLTAWGLEAGRCLVQLIADEKLQVEYRPEGRLEVYRRGAGLRAADGEADMLRKHGYGVELLEGDALRRREPAFRDDVAGALDYRDSFTLAPHEFIPELARAVERHGATFEIGRAVSDIVVDKGRAVAVALEGGERIEADAIVLAAGIWSSALAARLGIDIPMQAGKGYNLELSRPACCPGTSCVLAERFVAVTPLHDRLRLAGTLEFTGINHRLHARRVERLREGAALYLHGIPKAGNETEELGRWCGLRPCTADGLPVVGWAPGIEGLFLATGHAMMGLTLGPLTGKLAAGLILGDCTLGEGGADTPVPLEPLTPARYVR